MSRWKQVKCALFHSWAWAWGPSGMHRYSYECLHCKRKWDVYE